ncbi:hypothetical protein DPMN_081000 [Dreissena polymorpha]|uniref:Uncharacterized protein n=1 Tax=Dreissena polymorpha TaxID=45954 RepID=A0A9D3Y791_DREPO|nr:hypothetical protein DPMN_081000 [Dreissena polymorpha]
MVAMVFDGLPWYLIVSHQKPWWNMIRNMVDHGHKKHGPLPAMVTMVNHDWQW